MSKFEKIENAFLRSLRNRGIGTETNEQVPERIRKRVTIPKEINCIPVPLIESDEWISPERAGYAKEDKIDHQKFNEIQKKLFFERAYQEPNKKNNTDIQLMISDTPEEFVQLKREINTFYSVLSEREELPTVLHVCKYPTCLYNAIPSFDYCISHLSLDNKITNDQFFHKCQICETTASYKYKNCKFHNWKKHK